jgi:hypothetical protein
MILPKYSMGVGDRFCHEAEAQLTAFIKLKESGVDAAPVWNKSNREHMIIGTEPVSVRQKADEAVKNLGWNGAYFVDADHIGIKTVDPFIASSDFYTLDVADFIGETASDEDIKAFIDRNTKFAGKFELPGLNKEVEITTGQIEAAARKYLFAVQEAGRIYNYISSKKGEGNFVTEVSFDETETPQTPIEMLFILSAIAELKIPAQTIAPKFTGRFNKGVDYVGNLKQFEEEFYADLAVIKFAVKEFGLPENLKLSIHSGSDKFSIYPIMKNAIRKFDSGIHLKTAGTTWLEEAAGLALSGGDALKLIKDIYIKAYQRYDEMCKPYATVIDINTAKLPSPEEIKTWTGEQFSAALRHDQSCEQFNLNLRQLIHVGYKIAAEEGKLFTDALKENRQCIAELVTDNIFTNHMKALFL